MGATTASLLPIIPKAPRRDMLMAHFAGFDVEERKAAVKKLDLLAFRADQIARYYYGRLEADPMTMTDLPKANRQKVKDSLFPPLLIPVRHVACDDGETRKTLWCTDDGTLLESILMKYPGHATLYISSQAGCGMARPFCTTRQGGLRRNLSTAEIIDQVREAAATMAAESGHLMNAVFMDMGGSLANCNRVLAAVHRITRPLPEGFGISIRNATISAVGLAPNIRRLADEDLLVTLTVSLHTPDDELRNELIPINNRSTVAEILDVARYYVDKTGRRVPIEYTLIRDINDQDWHANLLGRKFHNALGSCVHVNPIPLNPTSDSKWDTSPEKQQERFIRRVQAQEVPCMVRDTHGDETTAACGQLTVEET